MQLIQLPAYVVKELQRHERNFLWGSTQTRRRIHLLKWSMVTKPKDEGGLGIQDLVPKNKALLACSSWRCFH